MSALPEAGHTALQQMVKAALPAIQTGAERLKTDGPIAAVVGAGGRRHPGQAHRLRGLTSSRPGGSRPRAAAQPSIASSSSIIAAMSPSPLSQNFGSAASSPNGASSSRWCFDPPASSISK